MAGTNSRFALGLHAPNQAFSVSGDTAGKAAGWTVSTGTGITWTEDARFSDGPTMGHSRWQRYTLSAGTYGQVLSAACPPGKLIGTGSHNVRYAALVRVNLGTGTATVGNLVTLNIRRYNATGTAVDLVGLYTLATTLSSWTLVSGDVGVTLAGTAPAYCKYSIGFGRGTATNQQPVTLDIAGLGLGIWTQTAGSYDVGIGPAPSCRPMFASRPLGAVHVDSVGFSRRTDHGRRFAPRAGVLGWDWLGQSAMEAIHRAWVMNAGAGMASGTTSPEGGYWPLLILPGLPSWPGMVMADIQSQDLGFQYPGEWHQDPAYFSGALALQEVY